MGGWEGSGLNNNSHTSKELEQFKAKHPYCCYCGGANATEEREDVPPKILFFDKRRPNQLIVPTCSSCNRSFSQTDQVVALLARSMRSVVGPGLDGHRISKMIKFGIAKRQPELLAEWARLPLKAEQRVRRAEAALGAPLKALNLGPLTKRHLQGFGARLAFGLHYHMTGAVVPQTGGAVVEVKTFYNRVSGWELSEELASKLGPPRTLGRTKKEAVPDQFLFSSSPREEVTFYFATFGIDFAFMMFVADDNALFEEVIKHGAHVHPPGNFFSYPIPMTSGPLRWEQ